MEMSLTRLLAYLNAVVTASNGLASLKNVGRHQSGLVTAAQQSVNFTWLITYSVIHILGTSKMTSLLGGVYGIVKNKRKENMGSGLGRGLCRFIAESVG